MPWKTDDIVQRLCQSSSSFSTDEPSTVAPVGIFQSFRPDGLPGDVDEGLNASFRAFTVRMRGLYTAVRSSTRTDSMKDAYFVVRNPPQVAPDQARAHAMGWLRGLNELAGRLQLQGLQQALADPPEVRVLEGKAPKHPKDPREKCALLLAIEEQLPPGVDRLFPDGSPGSRLSEALYFTACDYLLRDYLRWPLLVDSDAHLAAADYLQDYFRLWKNGIKVRVFHSRQVDIYLPR